MISHLHGVKPLIKYMPKYNPTEHINKNIKAITFDGMPIGDKKT